MEVKVNNFISRWNSKKSSARACAGERFTRDDSVYRNTFRLWCPGLSKEKSVSSLEALAEACIAKLYDKNNSEQTIKRKSRYKSWFTSFIAHLRLEPPPPPLPPPKPPPPPLPPPRRNKISKRCKIAPPKNNWSISNSPAMLTTKISFCQKGHFSCLRRNTFLRSILNFTFKLDVIFFGYDTGYIRQ